MSSAFIDLPALGNGWPPPADDPWNERLAHANLARAWENFRHAGARRLVVCRVLEARSLCVMCGPRSAELRWSWSGCMRPLSVWRYKYSRASVTTTLSA